MKEPIFIKNDEDPNLKKENKSNSFSLILHKIINFFPSLCAGIISYIKQLFSKNDLKKEKAPINKKNNSEFIYNYDIENQNYTFLDKNNANELDKIYNSSDSQTQLLANKQKLQQLESQTYSNRTMARMISCAELYSVSMNVENEQIYKKFDEFDNLNRKTKKELKCELILQIRCFQISLKSYLDKYKKYDFPFDYNEQLTLDELERIKSKINSEDIKYYDAIIKLLKEDTNIPSFEDELNELIDDEEDNGKKDPKLQLETDIPIMRSVDKIHKEIKEQYLRNPNECIVKLDLDVPMEKNEELQNLVKKLDERENKKRKQKIINKSNRSKSFDEFIFKKRIIHKDEMEKKRRKNSLKLKKLTFIQKTINENLNEENLNIKFDNEDRYSVNTQHSNDYNHSSDEHLDCNCCSSSDEEEIEEANSDEKFNNKKDLTLEEEEEEDMK